MIFRILCPHGREFPAHTVNPFAELLHIIVSLQILCYLGITGEMGMADIVCTDDTWQLSGCLKYQAVIEHLYLDFCPLDAVISMAN